MAARGLPLTAKRPAPVSTVPIMISHRRQSILLLSTRAPLAAGIAVPDMASASTSTRTPTSYAVAMQSSSPPGHPIGAQRSAPISRSSAEVVSDGIWHAGPTPRGGEMALSSIGRSHPPL